MNNRPENTKKRLGGVAARNLFIPVAILIILLHLTIIVLIFQISRTSNRLSQTMREYDDYITEATSILAGSSLRSETATTFVLLPVTEGERVNYEPMGAFAEELSQNRLGSQVNERFHSYKVGDDIKESVSKAAENADRIYETQLHAIALLTSIYPLPKDLPYTEIPSWPLTGEEEKLSDDKRISTARSLILNEGYSQCKQEVSVSISSAVAGLREESGKRAGFLGMQIGILRTLLWVVTISIILILLFTFLVVQSQLIMPLGRFVRLIDSDHSLNEGAGLLEVRRLASAYNELMWRRDSLDEILRSAAETDTLTNLPNRYKFEQYLVDFGKSGYSLAVFLFDINFLKTTNDELGHYAGDILIKMAADCISTTFDLKRAGIDGESYCFRFGGDEFAALVKNGTGEQARMLADQFEAEQRKRNISVSLGYAYTEEISRTTFRALMDEADRRMYLQKEEKHKQHYRFRLPERMNDVDVSRA